MSLKIDRLQLEIVINNDQSRKQLRLLEDEARQLKKELKKLPEASEEYVQKSKRLKTVQTQMDGIINKIGLTGLSMKELAARQRELNAMMKHLDPRLPEYKKLNTQLQKVNSRMSELRNGARKTGSSIKKLAAGFNHYIGVIGAGMAAMAGVMFSIKNLIEGNAKLSDSFADVRKTTGLTAEEVKELSGSFKQIDTRSPRSELLNLARIAGKLGVEGKENIFGFVKAADQINVALSEDLGGNAEEAIRQLGKLVDVFKIKDEFGLETGLLKVGSAINALGAASTANEAFIVGFTQKIGGSGKAAGFNIPDILGLASTMDILGATSEISTTAIQKMLVSMGKDIPHFAGIAGMELEDFSKILEDDVNEAFLKVLEGAKSNKKGLAGMVGTLESLGIESARAAAVASLLTQNTETLREQQKLANEEFKKGTSLTEEFTIKNNTLAARLDKLKKKFRSVFYSSGIMDLINKLTDAMFWLVENLKIIVKVLGIATVALVSYVTAKKLAVLWTTKSAEATILETLATKASAIAQKTYKSVLLLVGAAQALLTGKIKQATFAMRMFNNMTKLSPIGLLVGAVMAAVTAFMLFKKGVSAAAKAQLELDKIHANAKKSIQGQVTDLNLLLQAARDTTLSYETRIKAIKEINKISPEYLGNLSLENINSKGAAESIDAYTESILRNAEAQAQREKLVEINKELIDIRSGATKADVSWFKKATTELLGQGAARIHATNEIKAYIKQEAALIAQRNIIEDQIRGVNKTKDDAIKLDQLTIEQLEKLTDAELEHYNITREQANALIEIKRKAAEFTKDQTQDFYDALRLGIVKNEKEIRELTEAELKKLADIRRKAAEERIKIEEKQQKFQQDILLKAEPLLKQEYVSFQKRLMQAGIYGKKREDLTEQELAVLQVLEKEYAAKVLKIQQDGEDQKQKSKQEQRNDEISDLQESFDREKKLRKIALNEQLLAAGDNEEEKARLKAESRKNELLQYKEHLDKLIADLNDQIQTGDIEGFDLENAMLSDEEKEALQKKIEDLKLILSELNIEIDSLSGGGIDAVEDTDMFGMTEADWDTFIGKFKTAIQLAGELNNIWAGYNQIQANRENADLQRHEALNNKRKRLLDQRLADGLIKEEDYNKKIETYDALLDTKRRKMAYDQAKRQKQQAIFSTILNTASAVVRMLVDPGGIPGYVLAALAAITGGIQLGVIASEPLPQYFEGGYADVIGDKDKKRYRAKLAGKKRGLIKEPSILTAEKKPEYVVSGDLLEKDIVQKYVSEIERMRLTGQFYEGGFVSPYQMNHPEIIRAIKFNETSPVSSINTTQEVKETTIEKTFTDPQLVEALNRFSIVMEKIEQNGLEVPWNKIKEKNDKYEEIQEKVNM